MSSAVTMTWSGDGIPRLVAAVSVLAGEQRLKALSRAVNHTGDKAFTVVKRTVARQVGITQSDLIRRNALLKRKASPTSGGITYEIKSTGAYIPLKDFKARQTGKGVSAAPWNQRKTFKGMFIVPSLGSHVFMRVGPKVVMTKGRYKGRKRQRIVKRWGGSVPKELVKAETAAAFMAVVSSSLPPRVEHEVRQITHGVFA